MSWTGVEGISSSSSSLSKASAILLIDSFWYMSSFKSKLLSDATSSCCWKEESCSSTRLASCSSNCLSSKTLCYAEDVGAVISEVVVGIEAVGAAKDCWRLSF